MIYLDNAATTKPCKSAINALNAYSENFFYNPSSIYIDAIKVAKDINSAKMEIMQKLNVIKSHNVIFTSGATEANNLAIFQASKYKNKTILVSMGEHPSVFNSAKNMENSGYKVQYINLLSDGTVDLSHLKTLLNAFDVSLVSVMSVNNETGAVNDIGAISNIIKAKNPEILFHTDAVQGFCKVSLDYGKADLITISSHKIYGVKGTGALIYNNKLNIKCQVFGGMQENGLRSGTENVCGIMAFKEAVTHFDNDSITKIFDLKRYAIELLSKDLPQATINGNNACYLQNDFSSTNFYNYSYPYILSISVKNVRAEVIVRKLDEQGILVSSGSACNSKKSDNRVLSSMGIERLAIEGTNRISFSNDSTKDEVTTAIKTYISIVKELLKC